METNDWAVVKQEHILTAADDFQDGCDSHRIKDGINKIDEQKGCKPAFVDSEVFSDLFVSEIKHSADEDFVKLSEVMSQKKRRKKDVDKVVDGNVTEKVYGDGNVTEKVYDDGNVTEKLYGDGNVTEKLYDDGNVTEKVYGDGNVTEKVYGDGSVTEKVFSCEECGKVFQKSKGLASHQITHVAEKRLFACMFCDKGFYVRSNLTAHLRIHTGQKPYECAVCQKTFTQNGQLKQHERIHSGELPYSCSTCSKAFRNSGALVTHLRIHTGEKPYRCEICSRSFSTSTSLKTHKVTHSGEMLYNCPLCKREFNRKNNLNVHIKRHNKDRHYTCPVCHNGFVMRAHLFIHLRRSHKIDVKNKDLNDLKYELQDNLDSTPHDSTTLPVDTSQLEYSDRKPDIIDDFHSGIADINTFKEEPSEVNPSVVIENIGEETDPKETHAAVLRRIKTEPEELEASCCERNTVIAEQIVVNQALIKTEPENYL